MTPSALQHLVPDAPKVLCAILDSAHGVVQPAIRSEIFGLERFAEHGRTLGATHRAAPMRASDARFFPRLQDNIRMLRQAHNYIGLHAHTGYDISPAAEWLLDNFHLIDAQLEAIHDGLPRSYFRTLPMLQDKPLGGLPRVYGIAWAFVAHTDSAFDESLLSSFLTAYQETRELHLSEIWALPTTLRVVLIENLRRLAERVATNKAAREVANLVCDQIERYSLAGLDALLAALKLRGVDWVFLTQVAQRLRDRPNYATGSEEAHYHEWLQAALPDLAAAQVRQRLDQAADNLSVSNAVMSLRAIGEADWVDIVARTSRLMLLMLTLPVFEAESNATRNQTLKVIARLARRSGRGEIEVADALLGLMHASTSSPGSRTCEADYWLRGPGRPDLWRVLGLRYKRILPWLAGARRLALPAYLGSMLLGTFGLVAWILLHHTDGLIATKVPWWMSLLGVSLMVFPASQTVVAVVNRLISESVHPDPLPRLAFIEGIPAGHRVLVVIPGILASPDGVEELAHRLLLHYLANPEPHAQFALLTDWADAAQEEVPTDAALLRCAKEEIDTLNRLHPRQPGAGDGPQIAQAPRFVLLHRARQYSPTEQCWIGWERKRGKLELLVTALVTGEQRPFLDLGEVSRIGSGTPYIVTLDSDTHLPPGALRDLVGVAAHPRNQPRVDAQLGRVVEGYGILQPRVVPPLPSARELTVFHWLFAGQCGLDPYSAATSEVYQDAFAEGSFTGKGLLNVAAVHAVLYSRIPEEEVLSHDLLEGSLARCAAVTDINLVEDAPFHADVAASRTHRWMRGDWQLLPILLSTRHFRLGLVNRWKMFDNLRRSLVAPMSLALLLLALGGSVMSPWAALLLVVAAFSAGPIMGAIAGFSPSRDDVAIAHFYRQAGTGLARALFGGLWFLVQLLQQSLLATDAVLRALYRLTVSRRHLLQWTTAATAQAHARTSLSALARQHWAEPLVALALLLGLFGLRSIGQTPFMGLAMGLCLIWAASPVWIWWVSRRMAPSAQASLPAEDRDYLETLARDTWGLFVRCVGEAENHLPPDNLQTTPHDMVAHRTSPTNIGLYLLSVACAQAFGWIDTQEMLRRLESTAATLARLQRHRGHFFNWYDTTTMAPLLPMYVSTVDSGNLSGHLLAVAQACLELADAQGPDPTAGDASAQPRARLLALAKSLEHMAWEPEFGFLYHCKRHLFHIGFRLAEQQLDNAFYDLLASESRLTSLLAIAKGDVPVRHWACLGRPFYAVGKDAGLRSWSGSMFEYLMPTLILNEPHGSVLHGACHAAVVEQMAFAAVHSIPWGISESAYAASDFTLAYQYAPHGVPRLALRRTPPDELVVAPYATALAAQIVPPTAFANFTVLQALSARGQYGFIEALDYSPARQNEKQAFTPVNTFMAHHQGMTIVALANVLLDGLAQRWGMGNAYIEAVASLLHERAPQELSMLHAPADYPMAPNLQQRGPGLLREVLPGSGALEPTHLLSNGRYSVTLRANGAGSSRWGRTGISRWRDDALRDAYGSFFYLRSSGEKQAVSVTQHPAPDPAAQYRSTFHSDRICFLADWPKVQAQVTVWVSPEDDIEFRQVDLHNKTDHVIELELLSAFELTLSEARADENHPAFANLFVQARWDTALQALVFERKARLPTERTLHAAHFLTNVQANLLGIQPLADRQRWLGRNRTSAMPLAAFDLQTSPLPGGPEASSTELVTGLDPVCALAIRLRIAPQDKATLTFATSVSDDDATLHAVIDKYKQPSHVQRASFMSTTLTGIRLSAMGMGADTFVAIQALTTALVFNLARPQAVHSSDASLDVAAYDRQSLWRFGISGDRPILLVSVGVAQGVGLLRSLAQGLRLWAWGGVACDLVVINSEPQSYNMALQREIGVLRDRHLAESTAESGRFNPVCANFYALRLDEISNTELFTLKMLASVHFHADGRPLTYHVQEWSALHERAYDERHTVSTTAVAVSAKTNAPSIPQGVFDAKSGDFSFDIGPNLQTAMPWINVLANPSFGAQISESGAGFTWALNSRLNQLTSWSNDPVADSPSEWFLLQDCDTLDVWSVGPGAWGAEGSTYSVCHGQGETSISHQRGHVAVTVAWCIDPVTSVKQIHVLALNRGPRKLRLRMIGILEWVMGACRADRRTTKTVLHKQRILDKQLNALLCSQTDATGGFGGGTAFLALVSPADVEPDWTCDRRECFDARGVLVVPDHLGRQQGYGLDPCAALTERVTLVPGESMERAFFLGFGESADAARALAASVSLATPETRTAQARAHWSEVLGTTVVTTPDPLFDVMVNRWLLYQTIACRIWAKAGFYQAGGATGFRDQLQDAMALGWAAPRMLRQQIVLCASRQFVEGDVQHWWHAPTGAGVRTHISDDLLWLPFALAHYVRATGDLDVLDEPASFLDGVAIAPGAEDAYYVPTVSNTVAAVYEHAARAIDHSLRVGEHGLPLMGGGDWNDGMNRVGIEGRGESVWLGWFLCRVVADFSPLALKRGDLARVQKWESAAQGWKAALASAAWDGHWFKRAFFDDGQALGASCNTEARVDLIAQAWSVLSGAAPASLQQMALDSAEELLVDHHAGLIKLLDPPLVQAIPNAGYIQSYPPGIRENGGQYSHAAVWALMARAQLCCDDAIPGPGHGLPYRDFTWLSPAHRSHDSAQSPAYGLEPYAMAGDVYTQSPYTGRGGWSWYTGAAGLMHRAAIESIFGLRMDALNLSFAPCMPSHWAQAELTLNRNGRSMRFIFMRAAVQAALSATAQWQASLLQPKQLLAWPTLAPISCFVIPLAVLPQ